MAGYKVAVGPFFVDEAVGVAVEDDSELDWFADLVGYREVQFTLDRVSEAKETVVLFVLDGEMVGI